jgi:hypothetical protein
MSLEQQLQWEAPFLLTIARPPIGSGMQKVVSCQREAPHNQAVSNLFIALFARSLRLFIILYTSSIHQVSLLAASTYCQFTHNIWNGTILFQKNFASASTHLQQPSLYSMYIIPFIQRRCLLILAKYVLPLCHTPTTPTIYKFPNPYGRPRTLRGLLTSREQHFFAYALL